MDIVQTKTNLVGILQGITTSPPVMTEDLILAY
jgi:hypothetical protein